MVLPKIAQHPEVRAVPPGNVQEPQILPATPLDLPGAEHPVAVGVNQDRDNLMGRVGSLSPLTVLGLHLRRVQLLEQFPIEEIFVILTQQLEHVRRKQLTLVIISGVGFESGGHPTRS